VTAADHAGGVARDEGPLLVAARAGDEHAFAALTAPYRRQLHVHCYRMLGSFHDADDALQETMLRAWRGLGRYEPHGSFRAWMYRIATNASLTAIERRTNAERGPAYDDIAPHLQPYPDRLLDELPSPDPGSEATVEERESVGLAFLTAAQLLPPRQRAVLMLRDVLGWSAREVADTLGDSVASVNSALQRARERLERERADGTYAREHIAAPAGVDRAVVRRFVDAWDRVDIPGLVAMLADDALLTMPPEAMRIVGAAEIGAFFGSVPAGGFLDRIRLVPTEANGQPAVAAYLEAEGAFAAYGVMVLALDGDTITAITGFAGCPELLPEFGLPPTLEA
jgi:RNA polymerase sigma-70 factor (ECF subfamily)